MAEDLLTKEFQYYKDHQKELVEKYKGKYITIKDQKILGTYKTITEAYELTLKEHKLGTFIIQFVEPGKNSYTRTFHSRLIFAES